MIDKICPNCRKPAKKKKPQKLSLNFCATWKKLMQFLIKSAQGLNKTIKQQK